MYPQNNARRGYRQRQARRATKEIEMKDQKDQKNQPERERDAKGRFQKSSNEEDGAGEKTTTDWRAWGKANWFWLLVILAVAVLALWQPWRTRSTATSATGAATPVTPAGATVPAPTNIPSSGGFPLAGHRYKGYEGVVANSVYDAIWTQDARLWQPNLPPGPERKHHAVAIKLATGRNYVFNGVEATLSIDKDNDGTLDFVLANRENGKQFAIPSDWGKDGVVWATVESSTPSGGFEILDP